SGVIVQYKRKNGTRAYFKVPPVREFCGPATQPLLPAAMYKSLDPKTNHVEVNREKHYSTSRQLAAKLLCQECEQRFSRKGEKWVLSNGFRGQGNFPLQSLLKKSPPLYRTSSGLVFPGVVINGVDMDQLCYFGASVFWRAAAYRWHEEENIDLSAVYAEEFRPFFDGGDHVPVSGCPGRACLKCRE